MLGPALLKYGTEAQKKEHLPKIAAGLIRWCQGYSEPNAGSDLASLQTRAESDGDDFVINGQKIWTSYANYADWIFCLVRTDPAAKKHDGISFILFDMASKGVIDQADPADLRLFAVLRNLLRQCPRAEIACGRHRQPRLGCREISAAARARDDLGHRASAASAGRSARSRPTPSAPTSRAGSTIRCCAARSATFEIDEAALAAAAERAVDLAKAGQSHPAFSSAMKYYGTELNKRRHEILMSAGGIDALEWESERSRGGARPRAWLRTKANSIEGGTSEVMLGIVAKRILDLPGA